jgi:serine/threonine-protein kinase RsbW
MASLTSKQLSAQATFTNNLSNLFHMHQFVRRVAIDAGFTNVPLGDIELAVVEACANVVKHAYRNTAPDQAKIDISVLAQADRFEVCLTDWGEPFDPPKGKVPRPDIERMAIEGQRGGMGIFFMQSLMDEVTWDIRPGEQNQVRMTKRTSA